MSKIICGCGGLNEIHEVGIEKCFRYHVTSENELPKNKRLALEGMFDEAVYIWDIGNYRITDYTLFNQRMYTVDENGNWTRPKSKDSINSIDFN